MKVSVMAENRVRNKSGKQLQINELLRYSPGKILMIELIKYFFEKKYNYFDFGTGAEMYKTERKDHNIDVMNYTKQNTFFGFLLKGLYKIKKIIIL